jgi:hypothetical protein
MEGFNVVIPVGYNDCFIIQKNLYWIRRNIKCNMIYLLTSKKNFLLFKKSLLKKNNAFLIDENKLLPGLNVKKIKKILAELFPSYPFGWYYQQFLKMAFALSAYAGKYYLIWDADTIPIREIVFFEKETILLAPKTEFHKPYFYSVKRLIGLDKCCDYSFIAEHMMIKTDIMKELILKLSKGNLENGWIENIINSLQRGQPNGFSEFELYGTYCHSYYPNLYKPRYLHTFRNAGYFFGRNIPNEKLKKLSADFDTISLEKGHVPFFPHNISHYFVRTFLFIYNKIQINL